LGPCGLAAARRWDDLYPAVRSEAVCGACARFDFDDFEPTSFHTPSMISLVALRTAEAIIHGSHNSIIGIVFARICIILREMG
jgi:hypothetical protein